MPHRNLMEMAERFEVIYTITPRHGQTVEEIAQDIAVEQTVEIPFEVIPPSHHQQGIPGRIEEVAPINEGLSRVRISYRCDLTCFTVPQLLNVLFGNISLKDNITITGIVFPNAFAKRFSGPRYGVEGVRALTGANGRPIACTALKPVGLGLDQLSVYAEAFAEGGADIIKDDHGFSNQHFHPYNERVARIQDAVTRSNARTGNRCLYFPMVSGRFDEIEDQVRHAVNCGIKGILIAPMLVGFDTVRHLAETYELVIMGHPALTGVYFHDRSHGMTPAVMLGTIFRLVGADISIFPNAGGRFHFTRTECLDLASALRTPDVPWKAALPCPAGGMQLSKIEMLCQDYGRDTALLIGGNLLQQGNDLAASMRQFVDKMKEAC